jgi:hypothetical protein
MPKRNLDHMCLSQIKLSHLIIIMTICDHDQKWLWPNVIMTKCHHDQMSSWPNVIMTKCHHDQMSSWPNVIMTNGYYYVHIPRIHNATVNDMPSLLLICTWLRAICLPLSQQDSANVLLVKRELLNHPVCIKSCHRKAVENSVVFPN